MANICLGETLKTSTSSVSCSAIKIIVFSLKRHIGTGRWGRTNQLIWNRTKILYSVFRLEVRKLTVKYWRKYNRRLLHRLHYRLQALRMVPVSTRAERNRRHASRKQ